MATRRFLLMITLTSTRGCCGGASADRRPGRNGDGELGRSADGRGVADGAVRLGEALDALVDLVRGDAGVGEAQRVVPALEEELGALDELHVARRRLGEHRGDVRALG